MSPGALVGQVLNVLFPPRCVVATCTATGHWLCPACRSAVLPPGGRRCPRCAAVLRRSGCPARCADWPVDAVCVVGPYRGVLREAIQALKYRGVVGVAVPLAQMAASAARGLGRVDLVVSVPAHHNRLGQRWLDHAAVLARLVAADMAVEWSPGAVTRRRATRPQVGLSPSERWRNMEAAFAAETAVRDRRVLLLDDVLTTGATACAAAAAIRAAGARAVLVCALARADGPAR